MIWWYNEAMSDKKADELIKQLRMIEETIGLTNGRLDKIIDVLKSIERKIRNL